MGGPTTSTVLLSRLKLSPCLRRLFGTEAAHVEPLPKAVARRRRRPMIVALGRRGSMDMVVNPQTV
jgi:hypothetical protein